MDELLSTSSLSSSLLWTFWSSLRECEMSSTVVCVVLAIVMYGFIWSVLVYLLLSLLNLSTVGCFDFSCLLVGIVSKFCCLFFFSSGLNLGIWLKSNLASSTCYLPIISLAGDLLIECSNMGVFYAYLGSIMENSCLPWLFKILIRMSFFTISALICLSFSSYTSLVWSLKFWIWLCGLGGTLCEFRRIISLGLPELFLGISVGVSWDDR